MKLKGYGWARAAEAEALGLIKPERFTNDTPFVDTISTIAIFTIERLREKA